MCNNAIAPKQVAKKSKVFEKTNYALLEARFFLLRLNDLNSKATGVEPESIKFSQYNDNSSLNRQAMMLYTLYWSTDLGKGKVEDRKSFSDSGSLRSFTSNPMRN